MKKLINKYFKGMKSDDITLRLYLIGIWMSFVTAFVMDDVLILVAGVAIGIIPAFLIAECFYNDDNNKDWLKRFKWVELEKYSGSYFWTLDANITLLFMKEKISEHTLSFIFALRKDWYLWIKDDDLERSM